MADNKNMPPMGQNGAPPQGGPGMPPKGGPGMPPKGMPTPPKGVELPQTQSKYSRGKFSTGRGGGRGGHGGPRGGMGEKPQDARKTFFRLIKYVTHDKLKLVLVLLLVVFSSLASVGATYVTKPMINTLSTLRENPENIKRVGYLLVLLAGVHLASTAGSYIQSRTMAKIALTGCNKLRSELFDKLQSLPLSYFDAHPHGELMSRFSNDADSVQMCLEMSFRSLISSALTFVSVITMMITLGKWQLFLVTVGTLSVSALVVSKRGKKSQYYFRAEHSTLGELNGDIQEMIEGLKVVKAFTHEDEAIEEFNELNEAYFQAARMGNYYGQSIMPFTANISNIGYAITAMVGGVLTVLGSLDVGSLIAYMQYSRQVAQPVNQVSQQMNMIYSALAGAERIFAMMDLESEVDDGTVTLVCAEEQEDGTMVETDHRTGKWAWKVPTTDDRFTLVPVKGLVKVDHIDFSYVPEKKILKGVDVYAKPGQKIALVGSTGAGKTTIANLINRFYEIDSGTITYDGIDVRDIKKSSLRSATAVVLQDTHLFEGTVMENIRYGRLDATDEECIAASKLANSHSFVRRLPDGYNTMVTNDGANLSQGERQLLAIARATVAEPPVLVLDEATSSIDTRTERLIEKGLDSLMDGRTVFVIAHRLSTVRNSNCIVVIEHGEIQEKGDHNELLDLKGRYYMLYTGQLILD